MSKRTFITYAQETEPPWAETGDVWLKTSDGSLKVRRTTGEFTDFKAFGRLPGDLWSWGSNLAGRLGLGIGYGTSGSKISTRKYPVKTDLTDIIDVVTSYGTLALKEDGTVYGFGDNNKGVLGIGDEVDRSTPVALSITDVLGIATANQNTSFLKSDGTVWTCGDNWDGQVGNGDPGGSQNTVPVPSIITDVTQITRGYKSFAALKNDGTVWSWGNNDYGQVGNNGRTILGVSVPVQVLEDVNMLGAGYQCVYAHKNDGTVWSWGHNDYGQLGIGTSQDESTPVQISGISNLRYLDSSTGKSGYAITSDKSVWAWGSNGAGQLGIGSTDGSNAPQQTINITGISHVSGGDNYALTVRADNTLWAFGNNTKGQLGTNDTSSRSVPTQVVDENDLPFEGANFATSGDETSYAIVP